MFEEANKYPIKEEWEEYYKFLEALRRTGVTNMWGAAQYLEEVKEFKLTPDQAKDVLLSWITNYNELDQKYHWQETTLKINE
jgi:hypothetical protein